MTVGMVEVHQANRVKSRGGAGPKNRPQKWKTHRC